jgi:hypothetical protein
MGWVNDLTDPEVDADRERTVLIEAQPSIHHPEASTSEPGDSVSHGEVSA